MRALRWLLLAGLFFGLAALLMRSGKSATSSSRMQALEEQIPRRPDSAAFAKRKLRATLLDQAPSAPGAAPVERRRDPFLVAFPPAKPGGNAIVVEANAIRYSALGERLVACLGRERQGDLDKMKDELGIDVLQDIDRVGLTDGGLTISGDFSKLDLGKLTDEEPEAYGREGQLVVRGGEAIGIWKNELLFVGNDADTIRTAIDRLEGRAEAPAEAVREDEAYGEIYGHLSRDVLLAIVPPESRDRIRGEIERAAEQIDLHVNVGDDVGMVVKVLGQDQSALQDLAKSLGSALAVGRMAAKAEGLDDVAEILDLARVARGYSASGSAFDAELVLPRELLEKHLAEVCPGTGSTDAGP